MYKRFSSICIPKVDIKLTRDYIYNKLCKLNLGRIDRIIEIPLYHDPNHKRIIIKLQWYKNSEIEAYLAKNGNIKLVYDMPWYWKVYECYN